MRAGLSAAALCAMTAVRAESNFYVGGIGGQSVAHLDRREQLEIAPTLMAGPPSLVRLTVVAREVDKNDTAFGALVGYRPLRNLALEAQYLNLGASEYTAALDFVPIGGFIPALPPGVVFQPLNPPPAFVPVVLLPEVPVVRTSTQGPALSALGILPLGKRFEVHGRAGVYFAHTERTIGVGSFLERRQSSHTEELLFGLGGQWRAGEQWSVRADFQRFMDVGAGSRTGEADVDLWSLGVLWRL